MLQQRLNLKQNVIQSSKTNEKTLMLESNQKFQRN